MSICSEAWRHHKGVPATTVVVDGGWSNQSHKYIYNAKSGVGVIFEKATKNVFFVSVSAPSSVLSSLELI